MRRAVLVVLAAAIGAGAAWAAAAARKPSVYQDGLYGFSIQAPAFPMAPPGAMVIPVMMTAPVEDKFAANVNVAVQQVTLSRDGFRQLSLAQFKQAGFKVNVDRDLTVFGKPAILWDYEGSAGGRDLHWLALAVIDTERVFLVTCTAPKDTFGKYEQEFHTCVNSFKPGP
ncbi:MAG: hypothetical protein IMZ44_16490 [Planctomycetes bacterium]|nr:hypothetical protein [Planctomycetota bacterium]